jgi:hypothetical protein
MAMTSTHAITKEIQDYGLPITVRITHSQVLLVIKAPYAGVADAEGLVGKL